MLISFMPRIKRVTYRWSNRRRRGQIRVASEAATASTIEARTLSDLVTTCRIAKIGVFWLFGVFAGYSQLGRIWEEAGVEPTVSGWPLGSLLSESATIWRNKGE